jgi:hypothetical protein
MLTTRRPDDNHQRTEGVHAESHKALFAFYELVFHRAGKGIIEYAVAFLQANAVFLTVDRVFLGVELDGHTTSICTSCISCNCYIAGGQATDPEG